MKKINVALITSLLFDPVLVPMFLKCLPRVLEIKERYMDVFDD